jgi:dehydration protein DpgD
VPPAPASTTSRGSHRSIERAKSGPISGATRQISGRPRSGRRGHVVRVAYELGLVNEVVPRERLDECLDSWLEDVLSCAPLSLRAIKEAALASATMPLEEAFAAQYTWEERRMHSHDAQDRPRAFVEKRPPRWTGT